MERMIDPIYSSATTELKSDGADIDAILERIEGCVKDISTGSSDGMIPTPVDPGSISSSNVTP